MTAFAGKVLVLIILLASITAIWPASGGSNESYYLTIHPVGDHAIGELITISGTTNLPGNTTLMVQAGPQTFTKYPPNYFVDSQVKVVAGPDNNHWSVTMNTSTFIVDEYYVCIQPYIQPLNNTIPFYETTFNITPRKIHPPELTEVTRTTIPEETMLPVSPALPPQVTIQSPSPRSTAAAIPEYLTIGALAILGILARSFRI